MGDAKLDLDSLIGLALADAVDIAKSAGRTLVPEGLGGVRSLNHFNPLWARVEGGRVVSIDDTAMNP